MHLQMRIERKYLLHRMKRLLIAKQATKRASYMALRTIEEHDFGPIYNNRTYDNCRGDPNTVIETVSLAGYELVKKESV